MFKDIIKSNEQFQDNCDSEIDVQLQGKRKAQDVQVKQTSKKLKKELYKQPTTEELNQLRETENLFNNNLFRLQIKELLSEIQVKSKHRNRFQLWYEKFVNFIENLPEHHDVTLSELHKKDSEKQFLARLKELCKPTFKCDQDVNLHFLKPASYKISGLHALNCNIGPTLNVDINIEMPRKCFYEKDYLNNRYLTKRYYYLLYIATEMENANICSNISLCHSIDFDAVPVLKLKPDLSNNINIKINVVPPENYFRDNRFLPNKDNLKIISNSENGAARQVDLNKYETPYYNALLLQNIRSNENQAFLSNTLKDFKNALDGLQLLIIWLKQRELYEVVGITDDFLLQLLAYLINKRYINKHMSSYQVIRNIWLFISKSDWQNEPISICKDVKNETYSLFQQYFDVVFLDNSGCYNVTSFLSLEQYLKLKHEATLAVQYLDEKMFNSFDSLFMKRLTFTLQYDTVLRIKCIEKLQCEKKLTDFRSTSLFLQNFRNLATARTILNTLKVGLNKRISNLVPHFAQNELCFGLDGKILASTDLYVGINLNLDKAFNPLELGPAPHDPKVKEFINYWGELSTLRRFPDGTTCEAVYFETKTVKDKRSIIKKIIEFIAEKKLDVEYELFFDQFEEVIIAKKFIAPFPTGTNEESSLKVISIADKLNKKIRSLQLPLEIASILGNSDTFSYTEWFPPVPAPQKFNKNSVDIKGNSMILKDDQDYLKIIPHHIAPINHVIQLNLHSKWPDDLKAMRHIKTAFLLKLSDLLWRCNIKSNVTRDHLDVYYGGLIFRYTIYHPKEIALLKKCINEEGIASYKDNKESIAMEKELNIAPKIFGALKGIQSQYPSYGPSTVLIKRWLRSHLLDNYYLSDMVINLLNASLYLNSAPFTAPVLPQVAFLRFLKFLYETDWSIQMVIVNFNEELRKELLDEVEMNFHQYRDNYPCLFIVTPYDECKSWYTKSAPTKEVLRRISVLAKQCFEAFCNSVTSELLLDIKPLFKPNLEGFNIIIHLKLTRNSRYHQNINFKHHKEVLLQEHDEQKNNIIPLIDFNPVNLYLEDLRQSYEKFALFFHDTYGGNVIGVLWKPHALKEVDFKVSQVAGRKINNNRLVMDTDAIVNDFYILGKGIVKKIEKK